jgi:methylmalonyl-CoA/ethylmalonyl-CoA epimerase
MMLRDELDLEFDHVGVIVESLDDAAAQFARLFPIEAWTDRFDDDVLGVSVCFGREKSGLVYELIAPFGPDSPVARAARTNRDRLNQVAYRTSDLRRARDRFESQGALVLGEPKRALAFDRALVQFFYVPQGFIVELIEGVEFRHDFRRKTSLGEATFAP